MPKNLIQQISTKVAKKLFEFNLNFNYKCNYINYINTHFQFQKKKNI